MGPDPCGAMATGGKQCAGENSRNHRRKEATMELRMRLNVLAAIMSFGFLAAVVFGMI